MKKRIVTMLLCALLSISAVSGCGNSQKEETSGQETSQQMDDSQPETEETEAEEEKEDDSQEINSYGMTDAQQEDLITSVKESVTANYLEKYGINPADFQIRPFDVNEMNFYDQAGNYTGNDPYEFSSVWWYIDHIMKNHNWATKLSVVLSVEGEEGAIEMLQSEESFQFADTLEEEIQRGNEEGTGLKFSADTKAQKHDLENALYQGIAGFLNGLDSEERAGIIVRCYEAVLNSGSTLVGTREESNATMFDKVIADHIQFS